jgi:choice-of-anchor B domain-containing protein
MSVSHMLFNSYKKFRSSILTGLIFLAAGLLLSVYAHEGTHGGGPNGQINDQPLVAMSSTPCVGGMAGTFPCNNIDLASLLPLSDIGGGTVNDVWGWTDPQTGKEYALVGRSTGTSFVDLSDPAHPIYLGNLPTHSIESVWRGIKVYRNYAFIISEADNHGMQVFDLTRLRNVSGPPVTFTENAHYNGFLRAHTIAINEDSGFAYAAGSRDTCQGGLHMVDIRNPLAPVFAGCVAQDGYTHETQCVVYHGPDTTYQGHEVCFSSNEDTLTIVDVTNKNAPVQLSRTTYAGVGYTHQGWLTEDHSHFLLDDELDERNSGVNSTTYIWNVADLDAPTMTGLYRGQSTSIDHNLYIRGNRAYESNYRSGLRILDISNIGASSLNELAFFDIYPINDAAEFNGAWSNYPFFASGIVIVGGIEQGLFVMKPTIAAPTPTIQLSQNSYNVTEDAGSLNVTVTRSGDTSVPATVNFATSDAAGLQNCNTFNGIASSRCDYATTIGTLRYSAGETSKNIYIPLVDDAYTEGNETLSLTLSNPGGANLGSTTTAIITITDNANAPGNPIDNVPFFVREHYIDFLGREPDATGYEGWQNILNNCGVTIQQPCDKIEVSAGFFRSPEFQDRGYFIYRFYSTVSKIPLYEGFMPDFAKVSGFLSTQQLEANKVAFVNEFMTGADFQNKYGALTDPTSYVDALLQTVGLPNHPSRQSWITGLTNGSLTRGQVLRALVESTEVYQKYYTEAFVIMQYFGYLRRSADISYLQWMQTMNSNGGDYRVMINGFLNSAEYRQRFAP